MESFKKVVVTTLDTRKFVEAMLYLGSIGGVLTRECVAVKGMMLRAEVEVPEATPVKESQIIRVSVKSVTQRVSDKVVEAPAKKPVAKKTTTKKKEEDEVVPTSAREEDTQEETTPQE